DPRPEESTTQIVRPSSIGVVHQYEVDSFMQLDRCRECGIVAARSRGWTGKGLVTTLADGGVTVLAVTTNGDVCLVLDGVRLGRVVGEVWSTRLPRSGRPPMLAA
ncbi:MAG: hypothetical protein ACKVIN_02625, partial [Longimicrobiales bacterium]